MSYEWGYCTRQEDIIDGHKTPQENNCPLVAISKTVTSDDVQRAIEELSAITALQQMRTEPCGIIHHDPEFAIGECGACGYEIDPDYGWNHCPACGRKL